jgi:hypothetical protein
MLSFAYASRPRLPDKVLWPAALQSDERVAKNICNASRPRDR